MQDRSLSPRVFRLNLRLNQSEWDVVARAAVASGQAAGTYARTAILDSARNHTASAESPCPTIR
jgi:uncharacterized protein (DUF1778 family)